MGRASVYRANQGQGALEFALVSLMLMTLFMGVLDLGRGVYQRQDLSNAAREGARFAMISRDLTRQDHPDTFAADVAAVAASAVGFARPHRGQLQRERRRRAHLRNLGHRRRAATPVAWASALGLLPRGGLLGIRRA